MTEYTPKDIAKFTYRVPDDVGIPAGTPYVFRNRKGLLAGPICNGFDTPPGYWEPVRWTAEPIRRPLPTEPGSVIVDVSTSDGKHFDWLILGADSEYPDLWVNTTYAYEDSSIVDWTLGRIVPDEIAGE